MDLALRPLRRLKDSLWLWLAHATSLLEWTEASEGVHGSMQATLVENHGDKGVEDIGDNVLVENHGDQGVEDIGDNVGLLPLGLIALVVPAGQLASVRAMVSNDKVASESGLASSTTDEVRAVAKGCAFVAEGDDTLHGFTELIKCLIAVASITQGLNRLVNVKKIENASQLVGAAMRGNPAGC